jgi:hypothetical protein
MRPVAVAARRDQTAQHQRYVMARTRRIGILTGGGDVPGLNGVIKSVTYRASEQG